MSKGESLEELTLLESELVLLLDSIKRTKEFIEKESQSKYKVYNSSVVGEMKHRCVALRPRLSRVNRMATHGMVEL
jgi:hypothetical protein